MTDSDNPYQAPEAKRGQFSAQWRRPMIYTVAGSLCWFFAVTLAATWLFGFCYSIPRLIRIGVEPGWENFLATRFGREVMIALVGSVIVIPIIGFAGQSFLNGRGRRGLVIVSLTFCVVQLIRYLSGIE